jgi:hypothetical protein
LDIPYLLGLGILLLGVFVLFKPNAIVDWSKRHQPTPPGEISGATLTTWKKGALFLGAMFVVGGIYILWNTLKQS